MIVSSTEFALCTPLTVTLTGPSTAWEGIGTLRALDVALVGVTETREPLGPANETELLVRVALKPEPPTVTAFPRRADAGLAPLIPVIDGAAGGLVPPVLPASRPMAAVGGGSMTSITATGLVPIPRSGLTTVSVREAQRGGGVHVNLGGDLGPVRRVLDGDDRIPLPLKLTVDVGR